ncbi:hypothetical protein DDB_G0284883 [Dictyostelium discoideum AX4]|uniref:Membrane insertase YidC/Oxa/ALB C-terminal domain-containing protein n=1 Tax=Dictyostelium discoideum TaxID=44689 RepID=Q54P11_DICDI|nr:hypothetical protein DDB_G0284883 [Dictyostelium discoideum AX4]EAL64905.1 hypothetical protein DDB_G0284883 [Dictyostelium discoideum AX4]|eukprot:XP_639906.1 hypothetical protein DDB_G0284883 [Dictyostelium discoideum AX4]
MFNRILNNNVCKKTLLNQSFNLINKNNFKFSLYKNSSNFSGVILNSNNNNNNRFYTSTTNNNNNNNNNNNQNVITTPTSTATKTTELTELTESTSYDPNKLGGGIDETLKINLEDFKHVLDPEMVPITGLPSFIEVCLNQLHHLTSLPWLVIVPVFTLFIRSALFPLSIKHRINSMRLLEIRPQLDKFKEQQKINRKNKASIQVRAQTSQKITTLLKEKGCHPVLSYILPMANLPFLISSIIAFRDMAANYPSLKDAGMLWFTDLSQSDPIFVLPVICSSLYLIATELAFSKNTNPLMVALKWVSRGMSLLLIAFSPTIPSICYLYWIPSGLFTIAQSLAFNSKRVCKFLGLPISIKSGDSVISLFNDGENKKPEIKYAPELPSSSKSKPIFNKKK